MQSYAIAQATQHPFGRKASICNNNRLHKITPQIVCSSHNNNSPPPSIHQTRRMLLSSAAVALISLPQTALANPVTDLLRDKLRPDTLSSTEAVIAMLRIRDALMDIAQIASYTPGSTEWKNAQRRIPSLATKLRALSSAGPTVAALATGSGREQTVGKAFGGEGGELTDVDVLYLKVGQILNYNGRGIRQEAFESPELARDAVDAVKALLATVPESEMKLVKETLAATAK